MEKKEKVEFILEQMRLCLAKKDFVRTQIISKKISTKYFEEKDTHVSLKQFIFCKSKKRQLSPSPFPFPICLLLAITMVVLIITARL